MGSRVPFVPDTVEVDYGPSPTSPRGPVPANEPVGPRPAGPRTPEADETAVDNQVLETVFGAPGQLGVGGGERGVSVTQRLEPDGRVSGGELRIKRFLGLITRPTRGTTPLGALQDMKNLVLNNKTGALVLRTGGFASLAVAGGDIGGGFTVVSDGEDGIWRFDVETPSTQTIKLLAARNSGGSKAILQAPFFPNSSTVNTNAVKWGEKLASITIAAGGVGTDTVQFAGGSATADYYKYWILFNSTRSEYLYVIGSTKGATNTTLTCRENIPNDWNDGDSLTLYRHFHDNPAFEADLTYATSPVALQMGQSILFSGGQSSSVGCKACLSTYISKTLFTGATKTLSFAGTYVTEAEVKSSNGVSPQTVVEASGSSGEGLTNGYRYFVGYVFETDDGQLSQLFKAGTDYDDISAANNYITSPIRLTSRINKRFRKYHVFIAEDSTGAATSMPYKSYYHIRTVDMTASGFTYSESVTAPGYWTKTENIKLSDWNAKGETLDVFLGHDEANATTASFSKAVFLNNRLFIARYYDYNAAQSFDDQIRYSPFSSSGVPQYNVLPDIADVTETSVEPGDPAVIRGMVRWEGKLFIVKDNSCHFIEIDADPTYWRLVTVTRSVGCNTEGSVVTTPFGVVFAKSGDDIYLWDGGVPRAITRFWRDTLQTITPGIAWYEPATKTYNLASNGESLTTWYSIHFDVLVADSFAVVKHVARTASGLANVLFASKHGPYLDFLIDTGGGTTAVATWDTARSDDLGYGLQPYFKTAPIVLDEKHLTQFNHFHLIVPTTTGGSGTLDLKTTTAGSVASGAQTRSAVTKSLNFHRRGFNDVTGRGRRVEVEFNTNGTPATFTALQIDELGLDFDIIPLNGDANKTA